MTTIKVAGRKGDKGGGKVVSVGRRARKGALRAWDSNVYLLNNKQIKSILEHLFFLYF